MPIDKYKRQSMVTSKATFTWLPYLTTKEGGVSWVTKEFMQLHTFDGNILALCIMQHVNVLSKC